MAKRTWFTPRQKQFLSLASREEFIKNNFYLTGGTALSAIYYNHRVSEDLDLFSANKFNPSDLMHFLLRTQNKLHWSTIRRGEGLGTNNYLLHFRDGQSLKLDFVYYTYEPVGKRVSWKGIQIDSLLDIATNKLDLLLQRKKARDYIDLYFLIKKEGYKMNFLRKKVLEKFSWKADPIELSKNLLMIKELSDYPIMKTGFDKNKMLKFFEQEAKSLANEVFED